MSSRDDPDAAEPERRLVAGLGPIATAALVAGNIIGSGVFVIPGSLAREVGPVSLLVWPVVAASYLILVRIWTELAAAYPETGGMQVYAQRAFGTVAGTVTAFMYWLSCVTSNAAFVTAFVGYVQVALPGISTPLRSFLVAQALLWTLTLVNVRGVRLGGAVQTTTVVLKVLPLLVLVAMLLPRADPQRLTPFAPHGAASLLTGISLVAWMFVGAESVTIPAEEIRDARRTIRRAAYRGYGLATIVYCLVGLAMTLGVDAADIVDSPSPLAHAADLALGDWGRRLVTAAALISIAGVLNGWLLVTGRLPLASARQGFAPAIFGRLSRAGTPAIALVTSSAATALLVSCYFSESLLRAYEFVALASTATSLTAVGIAMAAFLALQRREPSRFSIRPGLGRAFGLLGIALSALMIAGSGVVVVACTALAVVIPLAWALRRGR